MPQRLLTLVAEDFAGVPERRLTSAPAAHSWPRAEPEDAASPVLLES